MISFENYNLKNAICRVTQVGLKILLAAFNIYIYIFCNSGWFCMISYENYKFCAARAIKKFCCQKSKLTRKGEDLLLVECFLLGNIF